ncbi:hypothetical protein [Wolbachia pipientis]|uniref:hypothetical protein n=1 Tax=Wolbachia pipientis TaxID=955 RepID=UPI00202F529A|nr:hypothetical protein [Wolbachia pipientis]MCM1002361.1 hypothetical protein [Wolbachia pipientis]
MEDTLTPLGLAMYKNQEVVKVILDAAKEQGILREVLTNPSLSKKSPDGIEGTLTPLGYAILEDIRKALKLF